MANGPTDADRLERLQALSTQIADAMAEMRAFETKVNVILRDIAQSEAFSPPYAPVKLRGALRCVHCHRAIHNAAGLVIRRSRPMHRRCAARATGRSRRTGIRRAA
jgi:hypothetical protein